MVPCSQPHYMFSGKLVPRQISSSRQMSVAVSGLAFSGDFDSGNLARVEPIEGRGLVR